MTVYGGSFHSKDDLLIGLSIIFKTRYFIPIWIEKSTFTV